jgi:membrane protein
MNFEGEKIARILAILLLLGCGAIQKYTGPASVLFVVLVVWVAIGAQWSRASWFSLCLLSACGCFSYLNSRGGLWNLAAFSICAIAFVGNREKLHLPHSTLDWWFRVLCLSLTVINLLGLCLCNPTAWSFRLLGIASFLGCLGIGWLAHCQKLDEEKIALWLKTLGWCSVYLLFSSFNQKYVLLPFSLPFLPLRMDAEVGDAYGTTNASGTFGMGELMGEFQLLCGILFLSVLFNRNCMEKFHLSGYWLGGIICCCCINILLANSRSCLLLLGVATALLFLYGSIIAKRLNRKALLLLGIGFIFMLYVAGDLVNWDNLSESYAKVGRDTKVTIENILNGEAINRGLPFQMGWARLQERSWVLGFGFGAGYSNLWAWTGNPDGFSPFFNAIVVDSHSLYLSLVPVFGWTGAVLYVSILLLTLLRLCAALLRPELPEHWKMLIAGMACVWLMFLIDEYKINALRSNNYLLLIWIFIGISHALCRCREPDTKDGVSS